jgi:serine-type D-Ala-D-Ala carboxypeptidase/endopeptidase (penicillin-binding protein 4)
MTIKHKLRKYFYRSLSALVAATIVFNSIAIDRPALAQSPLSAEVVEETNLSSNIGNICPNQLPNTLESIVNDPTFDEGKWGILVRSLSSRKVLYEHNPEASLIPASNIKLFTTAAAVQRLTGLSPIELGEWLNSINLANRDSNNRQAERLLSRVGGVREIENAIQQLGVDPHTYRQVDGSGLSRSNRAEPLALVNLLDGMSATAESQTFYNSLSVAGINGTLRNRLKDSLVMGKVAAKTGTLTGVRTLSGYLSNPNYGTMVFSIMLEQSGLSGQAMVNAIDKIVLELARVKNCS